MDLRDADNTDDTQSSDDDDISVILSRPTPLLAKPRVPRILNGLDIKNIITAPQPASIIRSLEPNQDFSSTSSQTRYATRSSAGISKKKPNYDMNFHPMDSVTRLSAKRTRLFQESSVANGGTGKRKGPITRSMNAVYQSPSASSRVSTSSRASSSSASLNPEGTCTSWENLFARPIEEDWHTMNSYDRYLFRLQGGAPVRGTAKRVKWPRAVEILIKEKFFTRKQFNAWGGKKMLKRRYELVRLAMRRLFGAVEEEPCDRKDWKIYYMEGWEVFDYPSTATGRRQEDVIVHEDSTDDSDEREDACNQVAPFDLEDLAKENLEDSDSDSSSSELFFSPRGNKI